MMRAGVVIAILSAWPLGAQAPERGQNHSPPQDQEARQKLISYLDGIADSQLGARRQAIAQIQTRADAERRKAMVREKILRLIGGLPESRGPVAVRQRDALERWFSRGENRL